jgi:hypothetical protein
MAFEALKGSRVKRVVKKRTSRKNSSINSSMDQGPSQALASDDQVLRFALMTPQIINSPILPAEEPTPT